MNHDPDDCPKTRDYEALIDRADWARTERKDREMEAAMERDEAAKAIIDKNGRSDVCECGAPNVWSTRFDMWVCTADLETYKARYGKTLEI